jgi:prepilin-type N-terminal cleavage/methylation domain-containing protein
MLNNKLDNGFTLIELLIVVAIIAILAAIAIPNFLLAQTRAKVAHAMSEMRSLAVAIEAYAVDYNQYPPNDGDYQVTPIQITTPIAYITSRPTDPFAVNATATYAVYTPELSYYTYYRIVTLSQAGPNDTLGAIDYLGANLGAFQKYGGWQQVSLGPDLIYDIGQLGVPEYFGDGPNGYGTYNGLYSFDILYDPTNGTVSFGNIISTQINPSGLGVNHLP